MSASATRQGGTGGPQNPERFGSGRRSRQIFCIDGDKAADSLEHAKGALAHCRLFACLGTLVCLPRGKMVRGKGLEPLSLSAQDP